MLKVVFEIYVIAQDVIVCFFLMGSPPPLVCHAHTHTPVFFLLVFFFSL